MARQYSYNSKRMNEPERKVFVERLKDLIGKKTQDEIANGVGLSRQSISNYINGVSTPSINDATKMAQYFGVSLDWLCGISDVKSPEADLQGVCNYLGISEQSVNTLKRLVSINQNVLNRILSLDMVKAFEKIIDGAKYLSIGKDLISQGDTESLYLPPNKYSEKPGKTFATLSDLGGWLISKALDDLKKMILDNLCNNPLPGKIKTDSEKEEK